MERMYGMEVECSIIFGAFRFGIRARSFCYQIDMPWLSAMIFNQGVLLENSSSAPRKKNKFKVKIGIIIHMWEFLFNFNSMCS